MQSENIYSINNYLNSRQLKLFDFGISRQKTHSLMQLSKIEKVDLTGNMMLDFILTAYNYAKLTFKRYSSCYSKQKYTQPQLFAILAYKTYNKYDYRNTIENLKISTKLQKALKLKTVPHYTTIQKFFKKLSVVKLNEINTLLLQHFPVSECYFSLDGTGFTNSYSDLYYNNRTKKTRRSYIKNHITVDSEYMLIRHHNATKGPKYDTNFAISAIRAIRCYKPTYILADKAYDTEIIKQTIAEETTALPQIPVKTRQKSGTYRTKCRAIFRPQVYRFRNQVEGVNSVEKRKFSGINNSRNTNLQIKETKLKNILYNIYRSIQIVQK